MARESNYERSLHFYYIGFFVWKGNGYNEEFEPQKSSIYSKK